jgi:hypothetical protein
MLRAASLDSGLYAMTSQPMQRGMSQGAFPGDTSWGYGCEGGGSSRGSSNSGRASQDVVRCSGGMGSTRTSAEGWSAGAVAAAAAANAGLAHHQQQQQMMFGGEQQAWGLGEEQGSGLGGRVGVPLSGEGWANGLQCW